LVAGCQLARGEPERVEPILSVQGLSREFGGLRAVDDVGFDLPRGHILALIGPNGAGKSTTVNLLSGALAPSSGRIVLEGVDLAGQPAHRMARAGIVRTFQNGRLFARLTVIENVLLGADSRYRASLPAAVLRLPGFRREGAALRARALELLDRLDMAEDADRPVLALPYGKQRKLEIARALILQPKVLLLDEPAAGLNSGEVEALLEFVSGLRRDGLSVLLIEHNMGLVMRLADSVTVMNFGRKIAEGPPDAVRTDERVIEAYLGRRRAYARV
jgi:ABC-type branched-subunit amino acid transport system ATPase component